MVGSEAEIQIGKGCEHGRGRVSRKSKTKSGHKSERQRVSKSQARKEKNDQETQGL